MARSHESFRKKENEKKKEKKRKDKESKKEERKQSGAKQTFEDMLAYVDENGNITSEPPDPTRRTETNAEDIVISISRREDDVTEDGAHTGTVNFFDDTKGFGFIKDNASGKDIFVHVSNLLTKISEGDTVTYSTEQGPKGLVATEVKKV